MRFPSTSNAAAWPGARSFVSAIFTSVAIKWAEQWSEGMLEGGSAGVLECWVASLRHAYTPSLCSSTLGASHQSQLEFRSLGHHALVPRRVPDQFHVRLIDLLNRQEFVLHVLREHRPHAATRRRQRHFHVRFVGVARADRRELAIVDQSEIDDIDRDLRVVTRLKLVPDLLLQLFLRARLSGGARSLWCDCYPQRVGILAVDAEQIAIDDHRVSAAERLGDVSLLALLERDFRADRHDGGFDVSGQRNGFILVHEYQTYHRKNHGSQIGKSVRDGPSC